MAELADALDLGSSGANREGSNPSLPTSARGSSSVVERLLAKEEVTGSSPASRSIYIRP